MLWTWGAVERGRGRGWLTIERGRGGGWLAAYYACLPIFPLQLPRYQGQQAPLIDDPRGEGALAWQKLWVGVLSRAGCEGGVKYTNEGIAHDDFNA